MDEFLKLANYQIALSDRAPCVVIGGYSDDSVGEYNNLTQMEEDSTNRYTQNYENYVIGGGYDSDYDSEDTSEYDSEDTNDSSQEDNSFNLASNWA